MIRPQDPEYTFLVLDKNKVLKDLTKAGRVYDPKKSCWVPCEKEGFAPADIDSTKGDEVTVNLIGGGSKTLKKELLHEMNPFKYEMGEDMADLTYLSEATVLHNLRERYRNMMIYTYSGLFCVVINPYKMLPIYADSVVLKYRGKRRTEMPPHLFAIADTAFANMLTDRENQSILITGESGAGKTENTKKVIMYFAKIAAQQAKSEGVEAGSETKGSLEQQIIQCNPPLEAYGNAKTVRNNNSSRFGKFIRIHFGPTGKIAGADIEHYLLEKSRVVHQMKIERNYHIFYQLCSNAYPEMHGKLLLDPVDPGKYDFINQGVLTVDNIDDVEEMKMTNDSLGTLGFSDEEKFEMYRVTASIMWLGQMKFKQGKDEQAEADGTAAAEKVAFLLGVNAADLIGNLLRPKVKVGNDMVTKSQTMYQVVYACATVAKSMYTRNFDHLVKKCNKTLDTKQRRQYFIGVLDIAGFEIFELNSFDQLCINFTNERLQQFFNHHMFVLEQEEYKKEGIEWVFIDFGMDLQACIDLIEKPLGILSILEEECMFPKATDKTFVEKLEQNHIGKNPAMEKPKPTKAGPENHFILKHYAGRVAYNCFHWLERNKDPINDCMVSMLGSAKVELVASCYYKPPEETGGGGKRKKGGSMQTISGAHRESLNKLMKNLYSTHPHFVRCIIPNEVKTPGLIDAALVLHQLQCNGVLEGIRICRKGFPNRMLYPDFKQRYTILAPNAVPPGFVDAKIVAEKVLPVMDLTDNEYKLGHTKVFFRAGILGRLEEIREDKISSILQYFQAFVRGYLSRRHYRKLCDQRVGLSLIQRNIRKYMACKGWKWWKFYCMIKPLLSQMKSDDEIKKLEDEFTKTKEDLERVTDLAKQLEEKNISLGREKENLTADLQTEQDKVAEMEDAVQRMVDNRGELESQLSEMEKKLTEEESKAARMGDARSDLEAANETLKNDVADLEGKLSKSEQERQNKENQIRKMQDEMANQDQGLAKLNKEKKTLEENGRKLQESLQAEEEKVNHLNKLKGKLEASLDEMEENLTREKKIRADVEKVKRKIEGYLKMTQDGVEELERIKKELEEVLRKKDNEILQLKDRIDSDASVIAGLQKKIKELQRRIEELEEELESERSARVKAEKHKNELQNELDDVGSRLDEQGGVTAAAQELNKRRDAELLKMRGEMEEQRQQSEQQLQATKRKTQEQINELADQVDQASKTKHRIEKERNALKAEFDDVAAQLDNLARSKAIGDKAMKQLEAQYADLTAKLDERQREMNELVTARDRGGHENEELLRQMEEADRQLAALTKQNKLIASQLDDSRRNVEDESRGRAKASGELRNCLADLERAREQLDEEGDVKGQLQRQLAKANGELTTIRSKIASGELGGGDGASEEAKRKLQAKLTEAETALETSLAKSASLERLKHKLQAEMEDLSLEVERSSTIVQQAEKKLRQVDKMIAEFQAKITSLQLDLENAMRDGRGFSAEVFRLKSQLEEAVDVQEGLRRENKNLSSEIHELMDQLSAGGKSVHEMEKLKRRLEVEKAELQAALEEAEAALEQEEVKVQRAQLDIAQARQDLEKRVEEKDEEMEMMRKNQQRALDSANATLEVEIRARTEAQKQKKKLEQDCSELEAQLDTTGRARADAEKLAKRMQAQLSELCRDAEDVKRARDELHEHVVTLERKLAQAMAELEDLQAQLEMSERCRKSAEGECCEANERINELHLSNTTLTSAKRKYEADIQAMSSDLDDSLTELKTLEDKMKKTALEAAQLSDDLRAETEHGQQIEQMRRSLEAQVKELQLRVDEAEAAASKGGKRQIARLEQRVREVEGELDAEQRAHQIEEDQKAQERLNSACDSLQNKLKVYKRQVDEAEEVATLNLSKYRKVQAELEKCTERADTAETLLTRVRVQDRRSASRAPTPHLRR